jgi:hypothetical protein
MARASRGRSMRMVRASRRGRASGRTRRSRTRRRLPGPAAVVAPGQGIDHVVGQDPSDRPFLPRRRPGSRTRGCPSWWPRRLSARCRLARWPATAVTNSAIEPAGIDTRWTDRLTAAACATGGSPGMVAGGLQQRANENPTRCNAIPRPPADCATRLGASVSRPWRSTGAVGSGHLSTSTTQQDTSMRAGCTRRHPGRRATLDHEAKVMLHLAKRLVG